jgi:hypothetical protein
MKAYGRVELRVQLFSTSTLGGGECTASSPNPFTTGAKGPCIHRLGESQCGSGHSAEDTNRLLLPNMEPWTFGCPSRTLVTAMTTPSRLLTGNSVSSICLSHDFSAYLNRVSYVHNQLAAAIACWVILVYCFTLLLHSEIPGVACKSVFSCIIL